MRRGDIHIAFLPQETAQEPVLFLPLPFAAPQPGPRFLGQVVAKSLGVVGDSFNQVRGNPGLLLEFAKCGCPRFLAALDPALRHLPGFVDHLADFKAKGIDKVACMAVNDAFVMSAWGKSQNADGILMLADGNADFAKKLGLELDATKFGMGLRAQRFALVADKGVVTHLFVEAPGEFKVSAADHVLAAI